MDETKAHGPIFHGVFQKTEKESRKASRGLSPYGGVGGPTAAPRRGEGAPGSPDAAPSPIYSFAPKNPSTERQNTRTVPETPPPSTLTRGVQKISSGTLPERGIITGGPYITMTTFGLMRE